MWGAIIPIFMLYNFIILQHKSNTFIDFIPKYKKQEIKLNDKF